MQCFFAEGKGYSQAQWPFSSLPRCTPRLYDSYSADCHSVLLQVFIAPVDKEDLLKQVQALHTEPLADDFPMVAPALAKVRCSLWALLSCCSPS